MIYVLMVVGCLECGEPTEVLGIFQDREAALDAYEQEAGTDEDWFESIMYDAPRLTTVRCGPFGRTQLHKVGPDASLPD